MPPSSSKAAIQRTTQLARHLQHHSKMSAQSPISVAPWREALLKDIRDMSSPTFTLATLHPQSTQHATSAVVPRLRTVVFRGFWASLDVNPKNQAPLNPSIFESDLPTITTDVRMEKIGELLQTTAAGGKNAQSGVGGPIEGVFWAEKSATQWRLRGHSYIIGPDIDTDDAASVRAGLSAHMRATSSANGGDWSWGKELTAQFGNLSPAMRGSFRNPPPGTPLTQKPEEGLSLGQKVDNLEDELARRNFRVVVLVPEEVDQIDLSDPSRHRRWSHKLEATDGSRAWKTTELWP